MLSDDAKRKEYDEARSLFGSGRLRSTPGGGAGSSTFDFGDLLGQMGGTAGGSGGGLGDLFGGLFGGSGRRANQPRRGADVTSEVTLDFAEAVEGATVPLRMTTPGTCPTCYGSGAKPGTMPRVCPVCSGTGITQQERRWLQPGRPVPRVPWHRPADRRPLPHLLAARDR